MKVLTKDQLFDYQVARILSALKGVQDDFGADGTLDQFAWDNRDELGRIVYDLLVEYYGDIDAALEETRS